MAVLWFSTALAVGLLQPHTLGVMDADTIVSFDAPAPPPRSSAIPMKKDLVEKAAEIVPDPLILVNLVSKRVAQLNQGRSPLVDVVPSMGFADVALTEIIEGKIKLIEVPKP
ncbi:MAG: DNA-directed RNA polymerase subunit omega [Paracoccaceae bacterium]